MIFYIKHLNIHFSLPYAHHSKEYQSAIDCNADMIEEALIEIREYCELNSWLYEIYSYCETWSDMKLVDMRGQSTFKIEVCIIKLT